MKKKEVTDRLTEIQIQDKVKEIKFQRFLDEICWRLLLFEMDRNRGMKYNF